MDQGRFFDQFFGIVFGTVVVVSQDWFFWIFWESVFKGPFTLFMTPLPAEDWFFLLGFGVAKKVPKDDALECVFVCVCVPQILMYSTSCSQ